MTQEIDNANKYLYDVVILSSSVFNEEKSLKVYGDDIIDFLNKYMPKYSQITIGNIKNGNLIKLLQNNQFKISVKRQHKNSLRASNRKLIKESDIAIFLNYHSSTHMEEFIEYADNIIDKKYFVFKV